MPSKMASTIALLLTIAASYTLADTQCPDPASILPCECRIGSIHCKGVTNFTYIKTVLSREMTEPFSLSVAFQGKAVLDKGLSEDVMVKSLYLFGDDVQIDDDAFDDIKSTLKTLYFTFSGLRSIPGSALSKLGQLKALYVRESNSLGIYQRDINLLPKTIQMLAFFQDRINDIDSRAFLAMSNLLEIRIRHCRLKQSNLPRDFLPQENMRIVDLRYSRIQSVPATNFDRLINARVLLQGNYFKSLPKESEMKAFLDRGNSMYLEENNIKCDCSLKWIPQYRDEHFGHINLSGSCYESSFFARRTKPIRYLQELNATSFKDC